MLRHRIGAWHQLLWSRSIEHRQIRRLHSLRYSWERFAKFNHKLYTVSDERLSQNLEHGWLW